LKVFNAIEACRPGHRVGTLESPFRISSKKVSGARRYDRFRARKKIFLVQQLATLAAAKRRIDVLKHFNGDQLSVPLCNNYL